MTTDTTTAEEWARDEFGSAELGDTRRTARLVRMAGTLAARPAGRITQVFRTSAERQGAYDLLSSRVVDRVPLVRSMGNATVKRCSGSDYVHVAVDGTSLKLTHRQRNKDFGVISSTELGARGLKVVHSYAIGADGVSLGVLDQQWWCRVPFKSESSIG